MSIVLGNMNFDPKNGVASLSLYKQESPPVPGVLPSVNLTVRFQPNDQKTVGEVRREASRAAIDFLREVIAKLQADAGAVPVSS